jgi:hypothetical protein
MESNGQKSQGEPSPRGQAQHGQSPCGPSQPAASAAGSRAVRASGAVCAAVLMSACGGGLSIGIGIDGSFDLSAPSVNLVASQASVQAGQSVTLVAAAADESGIEFVTFYRQERNGDVLLGTDGGEPYQWQADAPADGRTAVSFFARATDRAGNQADSAVVTVNVTP